MNDLATTELAPTELAPTELAPTELATTIDTHLAAYGETDSGRRGAMIAAVWAPNGILADPPIDGAGHAGINEMLGAVQSQFPGHTFRRTSDIDAHHGLARYGWEMVAADGSVSLTGMDVAELDADGKLARVAGFFGDLPARSA
jgi:hypothetical protein